MNALRGFVLNKQMNMDSKKTSNRNPLEFIASDYTESVRGGNRPSVDSVAEANPEHESALRDLLPVIEKLEQARQAHIQRPSGLATLGVSRPERLGDFQLIRQIGRGGMGVVFEAVQKSLGRRVALKVLPSSLLSSDEQLRRFEHEARTAAALHHTNIVPVFGVGQDQGFHYFVMQRIDGHGLDAVLLNPDRKLSPRQVAKLGVQAASALAYAHHQQVLHRDIKPANLLVNDDLELWVTDFGVAKALESDAVTRTGDVVGTLRYMAPEQVIGEADIRSDIYSLGLTLYELLAGRPAIDDSSIRQAIVARQPVPEPPPLRQLNPEVPRDLETILHTAMSTDPESRYQTANDLKLDLNAFLAGAAISVRRMAVSERVHRWARRNPAVAALSLLSMLLLASVATLSSAGFIQLRAAFEREQENRQKAEQIAEVAVGTVDQIFQRFAGGMQNAGSEKEFAAAPAISLETAELLEDILPFYDEIDRLSFSTGEGTPRLQESTAGAQSAVAELRFNLGHYQRAIETFEEMLQKQTAADQKSSETQVQLATLHNRLGFAFRMLGEDDTADQQHERALEALSQVALEQATVDAAKSRSIRFEIARTHYLLAMYVLPGMGPTAMPTIELLRSTRFDGRNDGRGLRPRGAESRFGPPRPGQPGAGPLRPGQPGGPLRPGHAVPGEPPPRQLGPGHLRRGAFRPEGEARSRHARQSDGPPQQRDPAEQNDSLGPEGAAPPLGANASRPPARVDGRGEPRPGRGNSAGHTEHLQMAISILRQLIDEDPENVSYSLSLARSLRQQEHDQRFRPRHDPGRQESELEARESVVLLRDLKEKHPDNETVLFEFSAALADHHLLSSADAEFGDSQAQLIEAADIFTHLCEVHPNVPAYVNAMVHTYFKMAMLMERESQGAADQEKRGLKSQAKEALRRAVDGYAAQVQMHPDAQGYRAWYALFLYHEGKNALSSGLYEQSVAALQKSVEQWNQVIESNPDERVSWRALPEVYRNLGQAFEATGNWEEAKKAFDMAAVSQQMIDLGP
jgi:tetratricopeptide (TPR) repeat protein